LKSLVDGSPIGHLHIWAPRVSTVAVPGSSGAGAGAGDCGAAATIGRGATASRRRGADGACTGAAGAAARGRAGRKVVRAGCDGAARPDRPRRCTLPITALRVTPPPKALAI